MVHEPCDSAWHEHAAAIRDWEEWGQFLIAAPEVAVPDDVPGAWWVAHTKPRNEKALGRELRRRKIPFYLPLRLSMTCSSATRRHSYALVPVFPGYLFVRSNDEKRCTAMQTNRIANALSVEDQAELIVELRGVQLVLAARLDFATESRIRIGQMARVVEGPLAGVEGVVVRRSKRLRLALNVQILSQSVLIDVPENALSRIDPSGLSREMSRRSSTNH